MNIKVIIGDQSSHTAPATLLGHNLELCLDVTDGLLTERLSNPKFLGPANPDTGVAKGWQPGMNWNYSGIRFALVPGMSLSGNESQLLHNFVGHQGSGIIQLGRKVRKGETLEATVWARAQHLPVKLNVGVRPLHAGMPGYDNAEIEVKATYWKEYTVTLTMPVDDDEALFFCHLNSEGMVYLDQVHLRPAGKGVFRQDLFDAFRTLDIPALRYPGGCESTNYHWKHGVGLLHRRPTLHDPVFKFDTPYDFGTDEYLALCVEQGIRPQISINIGSGTPDEAGEWAAYCAEWFRKQDIEPPLMYWQMGNEHYGAWEVGNMTGEMYVEALHEFVPAVKAGYPNARIIALGHEMGEVLGGQQYPWRQPVLEKAGDLVDVLALQWYACGTYDADPKQWYLKILSSVKGAEDWLVQAINDCQPYGKTVAMTEWNLWTQASHYDNRGFLETDDVQRSIFVSAMFHNFFRLPGLELTNFYNLLNPMGIYLSRGPEFVETQLADVFRLYRPALPGEVAAVEVDTPELTEGLPTVDAVCLKNGQTTWLFLTNRSLDEEAQITLNGMDEAEVAMLTGDSPTGKFTAGSVTISNGTLTVPPLTIARVKGSR